MAVQALTTINELLYRPLCSPDATDILLLEIFQNGIGLFQLMEHLDSIEERYASLGRIYCDIQNIKCKIKYVFLATWRKQQSFYNYL